MLKKIREEEQSESIADHRLGTVFYLCAGRLVVESYQAEKYFPTPCRTGWADADQQSFTLQCG
jgi:hypothetical protein